MALFTDNAQFLIQRVVAVFFFREAPFRETVLLSVFWVPWVKLGHYKIEITMKSCVSLSSNIPRVVDRSKSPRGFTAR